MQSIKIKLALICLGAILAFTACAPPAGGGTSFDASSSEGESSGTQGAASRPVRSDDGRFVLPYDSGDSLHPYRSATALNTALHTLVYDSLVKLDNDFTPVMSVASDIEISGAVCTVTLKNGIRFSDGTSLTAIDVRYSIDCIKTSSSVYAGRLGGVVSYAVQDDRTLVITLDSPDALFINLLDFPIIKSGTNQTDRPTGSGRYRYENEDTPKTVDNRNEAQDIADLHLTRNDQWHGGAVNTIRDLYLTAYDYDQSLIYTLKSGEIDFAYTDLSQAQSSTNMGSSPIQVPLTNLVYLGVNNSSGVTAVASFRKAIALCIDRSRIVSEAFLSRATAASTPFNPNMYAMKEIENQLYANGEEADAILDALGYTRRDEEGYRLYGNERLTLSVLVNTDNFYRTQAAHVVKENLAAVGIDCVITEHNAADYRSAVQASNFQLYIGETRLYANNDLSEFFTADGALSYGGTASGQVASSYRSMRQGEIGYNSFCNVFFDQSPFIPLVFRNGVSFFTQTMSYNVKSSMSDPFFNIEDWTYAQ